jgi:hypothetical protein
MAQHPFITTRWLQANNLIENDNWKICRNLQNEITSFCYIPNNQIKSIFLGTFPIFEISEGENVHQHLEFFYGSLDNHFWPILTEILGQPTNTVNHRIQILNDNSFGITDILLDLIRNPINSNSDRDLYPIIYNNIVDILINNPTIENVFITSGGRGQIQNLGENNKSVAAWLKDSINHLNPVGFNHNGYVKQILVNERAFNLIYLYSPGNNANIPISGILNSNNFFGDNNININRFRDLQWSYFLNLYHFNGANPHLNNLIETINQNDQLLIFFQQ